MFSGSVAWKSPDRGFGRFVAVVFVYNLLLLAWIVFGPPVGFVRATVVNVVLSVGPLAAGGFSLATVLRRQARITPAALLACGTILFGIGQTVWSYYEAVLRQDCPFPSWSDVGFLSAYPFLTAGVLLLPTRRRLPVALRVRVLLDGLVVMAALITCSWYFLLGPTIQQGAETLLGKILGPAYPVSDLILLFCLLVLMAHSQEEDAAQWRIVRVLGLGLLSVMVADVGFGYLTLRDAYATGTWTDIGWSTGYMLLAAGAYAAGNGARTAPSAKTAAAPRPALWMSLLPYALLPAVAALLVYTQVTRAINHGLAAGVYVGSAAVVLLIVTRQLLALAENNRLYTSLHDAFGQLEAKNGELEEKTREAVAYAASVEALNGELREVHAELEANNRSLATANAALEALATTDAMTGLSNHRAFQETLRQEISRAVRTGVPLSLLFIDVDRFKDYNDRFGHPAGDEALRIVGRLLKRSVREGDMPARYGGEEFAAILPGTDVAAAVEVAERIRSAVAGSAFPHREVTLSIGVAGTGPGRAAAAAELLIHAADEALYCAKKGGRNCVRVTPPENEPVAVAAARAA